MIPILEEIEKAIDAAEAEDALPLAASLSGPLADFGCATEEDRDGLRFSVRIDELHTCRSRKESPLRYAGSPGRGDKGHLLRQVDVQGICRE